MSAVAATEEDERKRKDRRLASYAVAITVGIMVLVVCVDLAFTYLTRDIDGAMVPGQANEEAHADDDACSPVR